MTSYRGSRSHYGRLRLVSLLVPWAFCCPATLRREFSTHDPIEVIARNLATRHAQPKCPDLGCLRMSEVVPRSDLCVQSGLQQRGDVRR